MPHSRRREREQDFRLFSVSGDTRKREGRGPWPPGAWESGQTTSALYQSLPGRYHPQTTLLARPAELGDASAVSRAEPPRWGLCWGRKEITRGSQEKKGGKGRGSMWPHGGAREFSVPLPARTLPKSRTGRSSHRLGFCVLWSGTLTPHYPAEEIHLFVERLALPAPS